MCICEREREKKRRRRHRRPLTPSPARPALIDFPYAERSGGSRPAPESAALRDAEIAVVDFLRSSPCEPVANGDFNSYPLGRTRPTIDRPTDPGSRGGGRSARKQRPKRLAFPACARVSLSARRGRSMAPFVPLSRPALVLLVGLFIVLDPASRCAFDAAPGAHVSRSPRSSGAVTSFTLEQLPRGEEEASERAGDVRRTENLSRRLNER